MATDDDDDVHPETNKFLRLLEDLDFAERYYSYCSSHPKPGPDVPLATQTASLKKTGRSFRYYKGEKFFAWRDAKAPTGCELGLNVGIESCVEWILVFGTPSGHVGSTFAGLARDVKQLTVPKYRHDPPYPTPDVSSKTELAVIIKEGLALYDDIAAAVLKQKWK